MSIHQDLKTGIMNAMKSKDEARLRTLRSLVTLMTNEVMNKKRPPTDFLTDEEALVVLKKALNMRKDSIEQFDNAGRSDLSAPEKEELAIIEAMLPAQMSDEELLKVIIAKKEELGITDKKDAGKLMGMIIKSLSGAADGSRVKAVLDTLF
jgi:uncharacterized protein YqeY